MAIIKGWVKKGDKHGKIFLTCPRTEKTVDQEMNCGSCDWLTILLGDGVQCRWTPEKERIVKARKETI